VQWMLLSFHKSDKAPQVPFMEVSRSVTRFIAWVVLLCYRAAQAVLSNGGNLWGAPRHIDRWADIWR
jgi:hypothetical protein